MSGRIHHSRVPARATFISLLTALALFAALLVVPGRAEAGLIELPHREVWVWGWNALGQLGLGDNANRTTPTLMGSPDEWRSVAVGGYHTLVIKNDGTLWTWGSDVNGWFSNVPTQIGTDTDWKSVGAGMDTSFAIKQDGTLWAWGANDLGQLGLGDDIPRAEPTLVGTDTDWVSVDGGVSQNMAFKDDGTVWTWGDFGDLGVSDAADIDTPTQVGTDTDWVSGEAGAGYFFAFKQDGTMWAWGDNATGGLGLGDNTNRDEPTEVSTDTPWASVAAGFGHTVALKSDGTLWAWGINHWGQLGLGDNAARNAPARVGDDSDWVSVDAGGISSFALKADGTLWAWGGNDRYQLGIDDMYDRDVPTRVGAETDWTAVYAGWLSAMGFREPSAVVPASISGTVTGVGGAGVAGVTVRLFDESMNVVAGTSTDASGHYSFSGLDAHGRYKVRAIPVGDARYAVTFNGGAPNATSAAWIDLDTDHDPVVDIALRQVVTISGTITDTSDAPVSGAYVILRDSSGGAPNLVRVTTDSSGNYTIAGLAPGSYSLLAKYTDNYAAIWYANSPKKSGRTVLDATVGGTYTADVVLPVHP